MKIIMLTALMCSTIYIQAQEGKPVNDSLTEIKLNEITISATRFSEFKKSVAQQVLTLNAERIAFYNQPSTAELLTHTGSVLVQKSQMGGGSPVIRGFEANKVLIVIDGVRMNNAIFRGGHLQNVLSIDNSILDRTEVLFGPSSVLYGSDALGGVMAFYTKNPALSSNKNRILTKVNAYARYGTAANEKTVHADLSLGGNKFASLTGISYSNFDDLRQGSKYFDNYPDWGKRKFYVDRINGVDSVITNKNWNKQVQSGYKQYDFMQKFLWHTGKVQQIFNIQFSTTSDVFRYDRLTDLAANGNPRSAEWYYGPQERSMVSWNLVFPASSLFSKGQLVAAYQDIKESRHNRNFRSTQLNHRNEDVKVYSVNADFMKLIKQTELGYGLEFVHNKINSSAFAENVSNGVISVLDTRYPDGGSTTNSYALYATAIHKFSGKFILNGGARLTFNNLTSGFADKTFFPFPYDEISQRSESVTGNIGMVWLPKNDIKISGLVSTGFRTPNVDDLAKVFESGNGTLIVPNPGINPEKTINYEVAITKLVESKFLVSLTGWYTDYFDALTTDFTTFNGSPTITYNGVNSQVVTVVNKNKAYLWGLNFNTAVEFSKALSFSGNINYTYGRIKEDSINYPLDHVAPLFGKAGLSYKTSKTKTELFALFNGEKSPGDYNLRGEDNHVYSADKINGLTPAWITANIRTAYSINNNFTIQAALENILDKYYRVFASGFSAPGRNFVLTLRANF